MPAHATSPSAGPAPSATTAGRLPQPVESGPPPAGVERLSEGEEKLLLSKCKTFTAAVNKRARAEARALGSTEAALKVLPEVPDDEDCKALLKRGLVDTIATQREAEAIVALKKIAFGMSEAFAAQKKLCTPDQPVPTDVVVLKRGAYEAKKADYATPGWKCVRFDTLGAPQRYQLSFTLDADGQGYRAFARGFSVDGGPVEELFVEARVENGTLFPSAQVMRK